MSWLINAAQLEKFRKNQKSLAILDASWHLPGEKRDAKQEFIENHIPGAQFLDLSIFHDSSHSIPNMLILDEAAISQKISALGIRNDFKIIFYDNSNCHTACRALWMFKVFGHNPNQLYILDGGLNAWTAYKGKTEAGLSSSSAKSYTAKLQLQYLKTLPQVKKIIAEATEELIDLRHAVRFCGGAEPREHVRSGHIPGSFSLPYFTLFDKDQKFLPLEKIRKKLVDISISLNYPITILCGSGMTAPIFDFILDLLGHDKHAVYDGSWSEWGYDSLLPGETDMDERPVETYLKDETY